MRLLLIPVITTVTRGSAIYFFSFSVTESANCCGVSPAACTSFNKGREILPSGRTGKVALRSASFQTAMWSVSSGPITYSGPATLAGTALSGAALSGAVLSRAALPMAFAAGWAGALCVSAMLLIIITINAAIAVFKVNFISTLLSSILLVSNLLQLVEQRLIANLQLLRRPPPVPAGPGQHLKNDFPFRLARSGTRCLFQRDLLSIAIPVHAPQERTQPSHGERFISQRYDSPGRIFQFANIPRPAIFQKETLRLRAEHGYGLGEIVRRRRQKPVPQDRNIFSPLPQGWQPQTHPADPVIKVFPELARLDLRLQFARRSADVAHHPPLLAAVAVQTDLAHQLFLRTRGKIDYFLQVNRPPAAVLRRQQFFARFTRLIRVKWFGFAPRERMNTRRDRKS